MRYTQKFADWLAFNTFSDPELEKTVQGCWEWAQAMRAQQAPRWLALIGASGTGKTHCARKLWQYARPRFSEVELSYIPHIIYWPDFIQKLRGGEGFAKREDMKRWPVLCLDDIGAERDPSGYAQEELNTLLGCRMNRWTILTSNLTIAALQAIDQRITSRLIRGHNICIGINTTDYSLRPPQN